MVWEPGDDGVVERPVAQRGFCQVHGVYFPGHHLPRAACGERFSRILLLYDSSFLNVERSLTGLDCRKPTYLTGHIKHLQAALFLF